MHPVTQLATSSAHLAGIDLLPKKKRKKKIKAIVVAPKPQETSASVQVD